MNEDHSRVQPSNAAADALMQQVASETHLRRLMAYLTRIFIVQLTENTLFSVESASC